MEIKSSFAELAKIRQSDRKYKEQPRITEMRNTLERVIIHNT